MSKLLKIGAQWGLVCVMLFCVVPPLVAFEGDYIWDKRFKASLVKAHSGQATDQYAVGDMYFRGRGTGIDNRKALHWFLLAAKQGHRKAAYKAGYLYLQGEQVERSPAQAQAWFHKSAVAGYVPAQYELGRLLVSGAAGKRDHTRALKWLGKAKAANYEPAEAEFTKIVSRLVKAEQVPSSVSRARSSKATEGKR